MYPKFDASAVEAISYILADTNDGLSGSKLARVLDQCGIDHASTTQSSNKRTMVLNALARRQDREGHADSIVRFIETAMDPATFINDRDKFDSLLETLNQSLSFKGLKISAAGKIHSVTASTSLGEAAERVNQLKAKLDKLGIHPNVIKYCRKELLADKNYFHSVFEATKGVADRIRELSGCTADGADLVDEALMKGSSRLCPILCLNKLQTATERSEQNGFAYLVKSLFSMYRNPQAHEPKLTRTMSESDALMAFQLASIIQIKLESVTDTRPYITASAQNPSSEPTIAGSV